MCSRQRVSQKVENENEKRYRIIISHAIKAKSNNKQPSNLRCQGIENVGAFHCDLWHVFILLCPFLFSILLPTFTSTVSNFNFFCSYFIPGMWPTAAFLTRPFFDGISMIRIFRSHCWPEFVTRIKFMCPRRCGMKISSSDQRIFQRIMMTTFFSRIIAFHEKVTSIARDFPRTTWLETWNSTWIMTTWRHSAAECE